MSKETKGIHPEPSEDSLIRELKKEIIKLRSLCRRASEKIRDLDDMIIKSIEDNKVIECPEEDKADFAGFSSINLLNRLDGITSGGYVENYDDLNLEMKTLDGHYQAEHPSFYQAAEQVIDDHKETLQKLADNPYPYKHKTKDCVYFQETGGMPCPDCDEEPFNEKGTSNEEHSPDCKWHKDWHACDCGMFDNEEEYIPLRSLYEQVISRINKLDDDTREAKGHLNILVLDRFLADITKLVGE
jgi:hypothetical protein